MQITITWTTVFVLLSVYFTVRYLYFSYLKWTRGCPDAFDPWVSLSESKSDSGWRTGYEHGLREAKANRKLKTLRKKSTRLANQIHANYLKKEI